MRLEARAILDRLIRPHRRHLCGASARLRQTVITSTVLWRNGPQLSLLANDVLPRLLRAAPGPARVAIHAGSIGCEAVSLAIAAAEAGVGDRIELVSFDIDPDAVARARRGCYTDRDLLEPGNTGRTLLPPTLQQRYLSRQADGSWSVRGDLLATIRFEVCDATVPSQIQAFGCFDLILFQNVLPHLRPAAAQTAVCNLRDALSPRGVLALGGTPGNTLELLSRQAGIVPVHRGDRAVYEAWSNRQAIWSRTPDSNLGLEPFAHHPDAPLRYAHLFCRQDDQPFWAGPRANKEAA